METNNLRLEEALASLAQANANNPNLAPNLHNSSDILQQLQDIKRDILEVVRVQNELKRNLTVEMEGQRRRLELLETKMNITYNNVDLLESQTKTPNIGMDMLLTNMDITNNTG